MATALPTPLRRLVLLGAPLSLGLLNATHPGPDPSNPSATIFQALVAQGQVDWWISLHLLQPILLGFLALAVVLLADGLRGPLVTLSRVGIGAFLIAYLAFDAIAGIAVGYVVRHAAGLPADQQAVVGGVVEAVALDPMVGGATFSVLGGAASIAWLVAAVPVVVGLARAGAARPAIALLALGTLVFAIGHPAPIGPIGMALFLVGTTLLEFGGYERAVTPSGNSHHGIKSGPPITATRPGVVR